MNTIDLSKLSAAELAALEQQFADKKLADKKRKEQEIVTYKALVKKAVTDEMTSLQEVESMLSLAKAQVFKSFLTLIGMKQELFGVKSGQQGHSFSDDNGNTITLGFRITDDYDDTVGAGIALVNEFIAGLVVDEKSAKLVKIIQRLLKKDAKGNLKPNRVMELQNLAKEENNDTLTEGVNLITGSYKPARSKYFIEAKTTLASGTKRSIALSITSCDFPVTKEGEELNFDVFK
ncbi:MAG: DUF3164 family protein [Mangrovibacterium sp.]